MKKVSVIVPVYNAEKYLVKCLDTLVNQTLDDIEILLVNDGSKDGSLSILKEYEQRFPEKIKVFDKENGGQASARNLAIKEASGEYIGCVDADDYVDTDMFRLLYDEAVRTDADMVACDSYEIKGQSVSYREYKDYSDIKELFVDSWVSPCVRILKRKVYEEGDIRFPEGYIYEDTAWFSIIIPYLKKISFVHKPLYFRMVNENSTMTKKQEEKTADIFPVMDFVLDYYREKGLYDEYKSELEYFYSRILLMSSLKRISRISDKKLRNGLAVESYRKVKNNFPSFKKNKYLRGKRKLYVKFLNEKTVKFVVACERLFKK